MFLPAYTHGSVISEFSFDAFVTSEFCVLDAFDESSNAFVVKSYVNSVPTVGAVSVAKTAGSIPTSIERHRTVDKNLFIFLFLLIFNSA